jgi:hypothetical protein
VPAKAMANLIVRHIDEFLAQALKRWPGPIASFTKLTLGYLTALFFLRSSRS